MVDAGTAKRPTGGYAYSDGAETLATTDLFTSPCKIQSAGLQGRDVEVGGRTSVVVPTELHLPASTAPLTVGDVFTVTTPHSLSIVPAGTTYRVTGPAGKTFATARRYEVEEVAS
jgi:hypothetical protein